MVRKQNRASIIRKDRRSRRKAGEGAPFAGEADNANQTPKLTTPKPRTRAIVYNKTTGSNPLETAAYILEMSLALRNVANDSGLDFLAYLLDMAAEEADSLLHADIKAAEARADREIA